MGPEGTLKALCILLLCFSWSECITAELVSPEGCAASKDVSDCCLAYAILGSRSVSDQLQVAASVILQGSGLYGTGYNDGPNVRDRVVSIWKVSIVLDSKNLQ